jgi:hypothetical protein
MSVPDFDLGLLNFGPPAVSAAYATPDGAMEKLALTVAELMSAARQTAPDPTEAQREAGNYKKGRVAWKGLTLVIETAAGQKRRPEWPALKSSYGYIAGHRSDADGDHIDCFISDKHLDSELVFVVDQLTESGEWDEHKVLLGWIDIESAKAGYLENYEKGWAGLGAITPVTFPQFKEWLENGDTKKPFAGTARQDKHAGVRGLARDEDQVLLPDRHELQGLRGEGRQSLPKVAGELPSLLVGHGSVSAGTDTGTQGRDQRLLTGQLSVGNQTRSGTKPIDEPSNDVRRADADGSGVGRGNRHQCVHDLLPDQPRVVVGGSLDSVKRKNRVLTRLVPRTAFDLVHTPAPVSKSVFDGDEDAQYAPHLVLVKRASAEDESPFTIAVDLDGTLAEKEKPFDAKSIGSPRLKAVAWVRKFKAAGARIIVFTVRGNDKLVRGWLKPSNEVPFDYVNENPDQPKDSSGKVIADVYWDDRAWNAESTPTNTARPSWP